MKIKMVNSAACYYEGRALSFDINVIYKVPEECPQAVAKDLVKAGHAEAIKAEPRKATAQKPTTRARK